MKKIFGKANDFRKRLGKWFWLTIVIIALVIWRIYVSLNTSVKVQTVQVTRGDISEAVSTSGNVEADYYAALTFPSGGQISAVGVKAGQKVVKGQFIAQIDSIPLNAAYEDALNNYRDTQAAVELEHDNDKNYGSAETFAQKATRTAAEVANDNAYNNLLAAEDNLKNAVIYAPFSGIIDTVSPGSPGINVLPGAANYTIVDPSSVYFDAEVEETDLTNVSVGESVDIKLDAYPDKDFQGKVTVIGNVAFTSSTGGNAYHVRISLPDNSAQKFKVGMQGDVEIVYGTVSNTTKVSTSAILSDGGNNYLWVIDGGRIKEVEVGLGAASDTETEIKSGVSEGMTVVDNPASNLKDGENVQY
ncbi:MAG: efflux RND transporter periplasmic adaptor subunit [Candidatus Microgenomates bacterium]|jgi:RND family efflux transporter MFP subunit